MRHLRINDCDASVRNVRAPCTYLKLLSQHPSPPPTVCSRMCGIRLQWPNAHVETVAKSFKIEIWSLDNERNLNHKDSSWLHYPEELLSP